MAKSPLSKGFLYLEILLTIGLLAIFSTIFLIIYKNYFVSLKNLQNYHVQRAALFNQVEADQGQVKLVSGNIQLLEAATANLVLEYFQLIP